MEYAPEDPAIPRALYRPTTRGVRHRKVADDFVRTTTVLKSTNQVKGKSPYFSEKTSKRRKRPASTGSVRGDFSFYLAPRLLSLDTVLFKNRHIQDLPGRALPRHKNFAMQFHTQTSKFDQYL